MNISQIPCGGYISLFTVEISKAGTGIAGAAAEGYCDANYVDGKGCFELNIQEANNKAMVYTMHTCQNTGV